MIETGGWGGIAHYAWNLCQALGEAGAEVTLLTNTRYELAALPCAFQVEQCFDGAVGFVRTAGALLRRLSALGPDIVHVQSLLSTRFDVLLWPLVRRRRPMVMTAHNVRSHEATPWESWTLWRCLRGADAVIVHTDESARMVATRVGSTTLVRVIHHGDYAFFADGGGADRQEARRLLDLPAEARILLAFGAIRPYKGILDLIAALPRIRARHPDAYLVIVGPLLVGTEEGYRDAIRKARVEGAVAFRPEYVPHARVATYFTAADIAVYNYRDVTDSGSLRVACSIGTPVVATTVGGFREFLTDGVTARLAPPGDLQSLVSAICEVLDDPAAASRMAEAARELATSRWSWESAARATLRLYAELLETPPPGSADSQANRHGPARPGQGSDPESMHAG